MYMNRFMTIELDGVKVKAKLLHEAPHTSNALSKALPFEAQALHARWCGEALYFPVEKPELLRVRDMENEAWLMPPGSVIFVSGVCESSEGEIMVSYGEAQMLNPGGAKCGTRVAQIEDLTGEFLEKCKSLKKEGTKTIRFSMHV
jgi:hypothetical protein